MRSTFLSLCLAASFTSSAQATLYAKSFPLIDSYADSLLKEWNISGLAIGIVHKDTLIYAKGYGYRDKEARLPFDAKTVFPIASNTKLFTATLACMLSAEGKLDLNKPARSFISGLRFYNDELTANITLRDMLSHRTGLPRYDGIWMGDTSGRKASVAKVVHMAPQLSLREGYIYNNMMYATAGVVMEAVTDSSWEALTRRRILLPLNMQETVFSQEEMNAMSNRAASYFVDSNKQLSRRIYFAQSEALGPAGTIKSTIEDMSHWMIAQLNGGRYKGVQVIPEAVIKQTMIPNNIADREGRWEEVSHALYGLGRTVSMYKGYKITSHTGSIDGFYSNMTLIPSLGIGIFMVHNSETAGSFRSAMAFPIIDRMLGLNITPWSVRYRQDYLKAEADFKKRKDSIHATQVKGTQPSHQLSAYTGTYTNRIYGDIQVSLKGNTLELHFRRQVLKLQHFHYDQFYTNQGETTGQPDYRLHFVTNSKGEIGSFRMLPFGEAEAEFVRKR